MQALHKTSVENLSRILIPLRIIPRRYQSKLKHPNHYQFRRASDPHEVARQFFDGIYGTRYGKQWPSIRCALLSRKKYAAIINNFADCDEIEDDFLESGAIEIVGSVQERALERCRDIQTLIQEVSENMKRIIDANRTQEQNSQSLGSRNNQSIADISANAEEISLEKNVEDSSDNSDTLINNELNLNDETSTTNLEYHHDRLMWLEKQLKIHEDLTKVCKGLKVYAYPKTNLTEFNDPLLRKRTQLVLDYFLLDGSSILPILALDPRPDDHILDICAAPGGKLLCLMQLCTQGSGSIIANDVSKSRVRRIKKVQDEYVPKDSSLRKKMKVMNIDATEWGMIETSTYDKVLVDVPCTQDRHSVLPTLDHRDNIFSQLRKRERGNLPGVQSDILRNAVLACRPGGQIVYSTCTASKQQNEYVVQMTIQALINDHGIMCEIEDLTPLTVLLSQHFNFFPDSDLGALVLPFLEANFGPTYVCKLIRKG